MAMTVVPLGSLQIAPKSTAVQPTETLPDMTPFHACGPSSSGCWMPVGHGGESADTATPASCPRSGQLVVDERLTCCFFGMQQHGPKLAVILLSIRVLRQTKDLPRPCLDRLGVMGEPPSFGNQGSRITIRRPCKRPSAISVPLASGGKPVAAQNGQQCSPNSSLDP
jgi:hypothetical protein